jgi:hypothetical protein
MVGRLGIQPSKTFDGVCALSAQRGHALINQWELPRSEDPAMTGQDLFDGLTGNFPRALFFNSFFRNPGSIRF